MRIKKYTYFVADFETTVFDNQDFTEVWAAAIVELGTEDVHIYHSISELYDYLRQYPGNVIVYYHNLKFDGSFWLDYLIRTQQLSQAYVKNSSDSGEYDVHWLKDKDMPNDTFKYTISDRGQWYTISIKTRNKFIELRDSLKLLPMSVEEIGKSFSKYRKEDMEYKGVRYAGCEITQEEQSYIRNDVLIPKEAIEYMRNEGHSRLTIGSCCLAEYKQLIGKDVYGSMFPDLTLEPCPCSDKGIFGHDMGQFKNADAYIRRAYRGGWVYVVPGKQKRRLGPGVTADVNSLYPSVMHSDSGNYYPIGKPRWWSGNHIPEEAIGDRKYFYVRIRTMFHVKPGKLPFIQIKGDFHYKGTECLTTSDVQGSRHIDMFGELVPTRVTLTLAMSDYYLFLEHYDVEEFEILDGCYFSSVKGCFDDYINKYAEIKQNSTGARKGVAKLYLNNLYGKLASNDNSSFKVAFLDDNGAIKFAPVEAHEKTPGHIASGAAVTAYARWFTITAAQKNYHGERSPGFCYADTDSIHCDLPADALIGVPVHPTAFNHWKIECEWEEAWFTRQKTYIEKTDGEYDIKCAGMTKNCKKLFIKSLRGITETEDGDSIELCNLVNSQPGQEFLKTSRTLEDFVPGLKVPGKLSPKRIRGGIVLMEQDYTMH